MRNNNWMPQKTRNDFGLQMAAGTQNVGRQLPVSKPLLALFMEHLSNLKKELRQRKALTMLQNVKSTKI